MKIEDVSLANLTNDPSNVRKHDEANLSAIKASLAKFGQQKPVVINSAGVVVAGNGTVMAARALSWKTIKAIKTDLTPSMAIAYAIADNRSAELATWDDEALRQQMAALQIEDEDLAAATGFDYNALQKIADGDTAPTEKSLNPVISFTIIFDTDEQQEAWFEFVRELKDRYPEAVTNGERLAAFLEDQDS